jgi:hypothetical protein
MRKCWEIFFCDQEIGNDVGVNTSIQLCFQSLGHAARKEMRMENMNDQNRRNNTVIIHRLLCAHKTSKNIQINY